MLAGGWWGGGDKKGWAREITQFTMTYFTDSSINGKKSIMQTRTDLPAVHILLVKHFLCLIELSVYTSVKRKTKAIRSHFIPTPYNFVKILQFIT
jgi:hypothetical protein